MKKILTYALLLLFSYGIAQKMAYVDTQYILKQLPQYQQSEQKLDNEIKKWQEEIVNRQSNLEKLRIEFENEKILLTDDQQKSRLSQIDSTDKALHEFIEKKFGSKGESINLRVNLVKPLQDQIWNAINAIAAKDKYNLILDKSSDLIMVYTDSKYDITDKVLKQLGIATKNKEKEDKNAKTSASLKPNEDLDSKSNDTKNNKEKKESNKKQQKSGWGRKYVPKNKQSKTKSESEDIDNTNELNNNNHQSLDLNESKDNSKEGLKKKTLESKINISATEENVDKSNVSANPKKEIKNTSKTQTKTGYGSKYVPKKKTQNNNQNTEKNTSK